LSEIGMMTFSI